MAQDFRPLSVDEAEPPLPAEIPVSRPCGPLENQASAAEQGHLAKGRGSKHQIFPPQGECSESKKYYPSAPQNSLVASCQKKKKKNSLVALSTEDLV